MRSPNWKRSFASAAGAVAVTLAVVAAAHSGEEPAGTDTRQEAALVELELVKTSEVCMVNDRFFAQEQIPVAVEGRTYYGCCEGCKTRLAEDESIRYGMDPVSGKRVDKATAVIGAWPDGSVLYFASQETFDQYRKGSS